MSGMQTMIVRQRRASGDNADVDGGLLFIEFNALTELSERVERIEE